MHLLLVPALLLPPAVPTGEEDPAHQWGAWRGPLGTGVAPHGDPPLTWSEDENVRWKVRLPGEGHSTPLVWGERVLLTTAVPVGDALPPRYSDAPGAHDNRPVTHRHSFEVLALARETGEVLWRRQVAEALPREGGHVTSSHASPSPATDGEVLIASFGSNGVFGLDLDGEVLWNVDLGPLEIKHGHGEGSSPVLCDGVCVVIEDQEAGSFVVALDARTGERLWRAERPEPTSWASPIVVRHGGRTQVVVSGTQRIRAYELRTGEVLWECGGLSRNVVASPVAGDGFVYAGSSYEKQAMVAVRLEGASGDVTETGNLVWVRRRATPYVPSPLLYEDALYFLRHYQGVLFRLEARTGEDRGGPLRLPGIQEVYASPVAAAGRVYVTGRGGTTVVLGHGDPRSGGRPPVLATNRLDDVFDASPALAGDLLLLRGSRSLYALAED